MIISQTLYIHLSNRPCINPSNPSVKCPTKISAVFLLRAPTDREGDPPTDYVIITLFITPDSHQNMTQTTEQRGLSEPKRKDAKNKQEQPDGNRMGLSRLLV